MGWAGLAGAVKAAWRGCIIGCFIGLGAEEQAQGLVVLLVREGWAGRWEHHGAGIVLGKFLRS